MARRSSLPTIFWIVVFGVGFNVPRFFEVSCYCNPQHNVPGKHRNSSWETYKGTSQSNPAESEFNCLVVLVFSALHHHSHSVTSVCPLLWRHAGHSVPAQHHHPLLSPQECYNTIPERTSCCINIDLKGIQISGIYFKTPLIYLNYRIYKTIKTREQFYPHRSNRQVRSQK